MRRRMRRARMPVPTRAMPGRSIDVPPVFAVSPPVATEPAPGVARPLAPDGLVVAVLPPPTVGDGSVVAVVVGGEVARVVGGAAVVGGEVAGVVGVWAAVVGVVANVV